MEGSAVGAASLVSGGEAALDVEIWAVVSALQALVARHEEAPFLTDEEQLGLSDAAVGLLLKLRQPR